MERVAHVERIVRSDALVGMTTCEPRDRLRERSSRFYVSWRVIACVARVSLTLAVCEPEVIRCTTGKD